MSANLVRNKLSQKITQAFFAIFFVGSAVTPAMAKKSYLSSELVRLQSEILTLKMKTTKQLQTKANLKSMELTGQISGQLSGRIEGSMTQKSRLSSAVGLGALGALLAGTGVLAPAVFLPVASSLGVVGEAAALGAAGGGALGALNPETVGRGELKGSIDGSIQGRQWQNIYDDRFWTATVIDPTQIESLARGFTDKDPCLDKYLQLLSQVIKSGKYFTKAEAASLMSDIVKISQASQELELASLRFSLEEQSEVKDFLNSLNEWMNKKILFLTMGMDGLVTQSHIFYDIDFTNVYYSRTAIISREDLPVFQIPASTDYQQNAAQAAAVLRQFMNQNWNFKFFIDRSKIPGALGGNRVLQSHMFKEQNGYILSDYGYITLKYSEHNQLRLKSETVESCQSDGDFGKSVIDHSREISFLFKDLSAESIRSFQDSFKSPTRLNSVYYP